LPNGQEIGDDLVTYNEPDRQANLYRVNDDEMLAFFIYKAENAGYVPQAKRNGVLQTTFVGAEWRVPEMLARIADDTPIFMDSVTQIVMPTWHNGRIVLIGDAAYCLTLISGQGASLAMGGAYFLAQALKQSPDHQTAFIQYENRLRPYIEETQEKARRFAPRFVPGSQFQIWLNNLIVKLANVSFFSRLVGKQFNTQSLLETAEREPVTGLKRYLFRAPIFLYRIGLGGLLGKRFLLLNHIGRKSGQQRQTVLEVVNHDKETDTFYIASGFGKKSDWYLNILEHPQVNIQVGWRKMAVTAVPLSPEESGKAMVDYARRHPNAAKNLGKLIGYDATSEAEYRAIGRDAIPFIALKPR
jgi:deazaflavin-dependent oxidoreductase (nitroreductase family)